MWLTRGTRPDLGFRLAELQQRWADPALSVQAVIDFNRLVNDAKRDHFEITYYPIDVATAAVVGGRCELEQRRSNQDREPGRIGSTICRQRRWEVHARLRWQGLLAFVAVAQDQTPRA